MSWTLVSATTGVYTTLSATTGVYTVTSATTGSYGATSATTGVFSLLTATDASRQFLGIGPIDQGGDVDFVLSVEEERIIYLSELQPYVLLQEVMVGI